MSIERLAAAVGRHMIRGTGRAIVWRGKNINNLESVRLGQYSGIYTERSASLIERRRRYLTECLDTFQSRSRNTACYVMGDKMYCFRTSGNVLATELANENFAQFWNRLCNSGQLRVDRRWELFRSAVTNCLLTSWRDSAVSVVLWVWSRVSPRPSWDVWWTDSHCDRGFSQ